MAHIYHRPPRPQEGATARPGCVHSHVDPPRERGWAGFARVRSTWFSTRPLFCQTRNEGLLNHSPIRPDTGLPSPSSLSLPSSAHARKRRGKVVNARHEGRRRTALFLDFIQGEYILLPFAPKDSAPTSRVHLVGGTSCLSNFFPPSSFSSHGFFQRERTSLSPRKLNEQDIFNQGREDEAKIIYGYRRS